MSREDQISELRELIAEGKRLMEIYPNDYLLKLQIQQDEYRLSKLTDPQ